MTNVPQRGTENLDVTISTTEQGSTNLWIGEHFTGRENNWRPGGRSFYLPMTTQDHRDQSAAFIQFLMEQYTSVCESIPVQAPRVTATTRQDSAFAQYLNNRQNGPVTVVQPRNSAPASQPAKAPTAGRTFRDQLAGK